MTSPLYHHVTSDDDNDDETTPYTEHQNHGSQSPRASNPTEDQGRRKWATALFSLSTVLLFADQNLMSPNLSAMARDFGLDDLERDRKLGGDIALAFFLLGAPASLIIGCLGDVGNRTLLFAVTVGLGEGSCFMTFFCQTYAQLYVCRAITGLSLGGALPLIYSILGDLFASDERHTVSAAVGIGTGLGIAAGQGVAGFLGPTFGWRLPFLVVSVPALVCAALVALTVSDPERGGMEQAVLEYRHDGDESVEMTPMDDDEVIDVLASVALPTERDVALNDSITSFDWRLHWSTFRLLVSTPTVLLALLQGAPGCLPWGIVNTYLNDFLSENRGMSVEYATFAVLLFGLGNFFGMVIGGSGGSYLFRLDRRYPPLFAGIMAILGCFPFWILLNDIDRSSSWLTLSTVTILAGMGSGVTGPIVKATLQNVTQPQMRGQAFALFNTFDDFGRGLGPVFVAMMIANVGGRTPAFNIGVFGWIVCGVFNLFMFWTVVGDEDHVQRVLAARLAKRRSDVQSHLVATVLSDEVDVSRVVRRDVGLN